MSAPTKEVLKHWRDTLQDELQNKVIPFWMSHSLDKMHGGYYNNLDRDGSVYDTTKHVWLQGREAWVFAKLYNARTEFHTPEILAAAKLGVDFLRKYAHNPDTHRVFFALSEDGKPVYLQRKLFSECFYLMALSEYGKATGEADYEAEAEAVFEAVLKWARYGGMPEGRPDYPGVVHFESLAVPMIMLNVMHDLCTKVDQSFDAQRFNTKYATWADWAFKSIQKHIQLDRKVVLENIPQDGVPYLKSPDGRLTNPGHSIECGWFLLWHGERVGNAEVQATALNIIQWSYDFGWDEDIHGGGILYFKDVLGYDPVQLEWNMKLWWPHNEAMIAMLLAYKHTKDPKYWDKFLQVTNYSWKHFRDTQYGEWFGYLDRNGHVTHRFKGGAYKCAFHVPRALMMCVQLLESMIQHP